MDEITFKYKGRVITCKGRYMTSIHEFVIIEVWEEGEDITKSFDNDFSDIQHDADVEFDAHLHDCAFDAEIDRRKNEQEDKS